MGFKTRMKRAWNAFTNRDPTKQFNSYGSGYTSRPDRIFIGNYTKKGIVTSLFNRIAIDVAQLNIVHAQHDDEGRYIGDVDSTLNRCLTRYANKDQTSRSFIQNAVESLLDEGVIAIIPVDTFVEEGTDMPLEWEITSMRVGKIMTWYPDHVEVELYNDRKGSKERIVLPKKKVAIVENPFYSVINEPNSTMQRLIRKLSLLDASDERANSGKLDLIIQLPYTLKTDLQRDNAKKRQESIEMQLTDSQHGIAYIDGTEKVIQLNRPVENKLMEQIDSLTSMVFAQFGLTQSILDGTADQQTMLNYYNRTIEPIAAALVDSMAIKFLTPLDIVEKRTIEMFRDPFKLVPVSDIADIADKLTRNEIASPNELRAKIGMKPSNDPKADELRNRNVKQSNAELEQNYDEHDEIQNE